MKQPAWCLSTNSAQPSLSGRLKQVSVCASRVFVSPSQVGALNIHPLPVKSIRQRLRVWGLSTGTNHRGANWIPNKPLSFRRSTFVPITRSIFLSLSLKGARGQWHTSVGTGVSDATLRYLSSKGNADSQTTHCSSQAGTVSLMQVWEKHDRLKKWLKYFYHLNTFFISLEKRAFSTLEMTDLDITTWRSTTF